MTDKRTSACITDTFMSCDEKEKALRERIAELETIVAKWPRTKEGALAVFGKPVWCYLNGELCRSSLELLYGVDHRIDDDGEDFLEAVFKVGCAISIDVRDCYSTREAAEAAEAAKGAKDNGKD